MTDQNGSNASVNAAPEPTSGPIPRHAEPDGNAPDATPAVPSTSSANGAGGGRGRIPGDQETSVFPKPPVSEATAPAPPLWTPPRTQAPAEPPRAAVPTTGQPDKPAAPPAPQFRQDPQGQAPRPPQGQQGGHTGQFAQQPRTEMTQAAQQFRADVPPPVAQQLRGDAQQVAQQFGYNNQPQQAGQQFTGYGFDPGAQAAAAQHQTRRPQGPAGSGVAGSLPTGESGQAMPDLLKNGAQKTSGSAVRRMFGMGESKKEIAYRELVGRIRSEVPKFVKVAAFGAGGRKTVTGTVAQVFAAQRAGADRQIAVDLDLDGSDFAERTARNPEGFTLKDLLEAGDYTTSTKVARFTGLTESNLQIVDGWWSAASDEPLDAVDVFSLDEYLSYHYAIAFYVNGKGVQGLPEGYHDDPDHVPAAAPSGAVLELTDVGLIVAEATLPGVRRAGNLINWMKQHGYDELLQHSIVVLNHTQKKPRIEVESTKEWFAGKKIRVREIPFDPHLNEGGQISLDLLEPKTLRAFENLAADIADDWSGRPAPLLVDEKRK